MVPSVKNADNPFNHSKVMCNWQGPYQVTSSINGSPAEFNVHLMGTDQDKPIH